MKAFNESDGDTLARCNCRQKSAIGWSETVVVRWRSTAAAESGHLTNDGNERLVYSRTGRPDRDIILIDADRKSKTSPS